MSRRAVAAAMLLAVAAACGPPPTLKLPTGSPAPLTDTSPIAADALARCAGISSMTAELGLSGRVGATKLRGRLQIGLAQPDRVRIEAVAPFGAPFFILVGSGNTATLVLPRDSRVLRGAPPAAILGALAGLDVAPDDLRAWLSGCPAASFAPGAARAFGADWAAIDDGGRTAWFHHVGRWRLEQSSAGGLIVELTGWTADGPALVRIRRDAAGDLPALDVRLAVSQRETNPALADAAFAVDVPADATPISLDELRQSGPLRDAPVDKGR